MSKSKTVHDPPPPLYTKLKLTPAPFSKERAGGKCCLTANSWRRLRDWIDEHYGHPDLPAKLCESMTIAQLHAWCKDQLWREAGLVIRHYAMEIPSLSFRNQLDEDAIIEAVKNLGWQIDSKGLIQRGGGNGLPNRN